MKRIFLIIVCFALLVATCGMLVSCGAPKTKNSIDFGKKYIFDENSDNDERTYNNTYYVFNSDNTGYCEYYAESISILDDSYIYIHSGRVEFVWREVSNGAIYLFRTETHYNDNHNGGENIPLIDAPIYFSEEFFVYTSQSMGGECYIKEGSKLEEILED